MKTDAAEVLRELRRIADPVKAKILSRFFKTGKGEYGEGDVFLGIMVPDSRIIARKYSELELPEVKKLLHSKFHEARLIGLLILVHNFERDDAAAQGIIYRFYLSNATRINNWDLVDLSASRIVGVYLEKRNRAILLKLAKSKNLWERRIAIIATLAFIVKKDYRDTFRIAEMLMTDSHDLIHKATGWMLREVGKRCGESVLEKFLQKHASHMPRTMLRYAIERFPKKKRIYFLNR